MNTQNPAESWAPVPGLEGLYEVSDQGRVRTLPRLITTTSGARYYRPSQPRVLSPSVHRTTGEHYFTATVNKTQSRRLIKTTVLEAHRGSAPAGHVAHRLAGPVTDNRLENLRWIPREQAVRRQREARTRCKWGHELTEANLTPVHAVHGTRACLACTRAYGERRQAGMDRSHHQAVSDRHYAAICAGLAPLAQRRPGYCLRGHKVTPANTRTASNGKTTCLACYLARVRIPKQDTPERKRAVAELADQVYAAGGVLPPLPPRDKCNRGHRLTGPNLMPSALARGKRSCLACNRGNVLYRSRVRRGAICADPELLEEIIAAKYREIVNSGA